MTFSRSWNENDPDGDIITISELDDSQRDTKAAIRERLEGDPTDSYSGIFESGSFQNFAKIRQGTARAHVALDAGIAALPKIDGAMAISSDGKRLYHLASAGAAEIEYLNRSGARAATGDIDLGAHNIKNLKAATANGHAVEFAQAAIINQQRTVSGSWTFNRGAGQSPFSVSDSVNKVTNLDADKLDGHHADEFLLAGDLPTDKIVRVTQNGYQFDTTYGTITELSFALPAGAVWYFELFVKLICPVDFNVRLTGLNSYNLVYIKGSDMGEAGSVTGATPNLSGSASIQALQIVGNIQAVVNDANVTIQAKSTVTGGSNNIVVSQGSSLFLLKS